MSEFKYEIGQKVGVYCSEKIIPCTVVIDRYHMEKGTATQNAITKEPTIMNKSFNYYGLEGFEHDAREDIIFPIDDDLLKGEDNEREKSPDRPILQPL